MAEPVVLGHVDQGTGPVVVLLHSTAADARMWAGQLPVLTAGHRVVAPDLRGYGATPLPPHPYCHAADVAHLLDHLGIEEYALVGSSGGGNVALQLASAQPARVRRLILLCPAADGVEPTPALRSFWHQEGALLDAGDLDAAARLNAETWLGPDAGEAVRDTVFTMQREAFTLQLNAGAAEESDWPVALDRIVMPTTVAVGAHDLDYFTAVGRYLHDHLADGELIELDWAGHLPALERPTWIAHWLRDGLRDRPAG